MNGRMDKNISSCNLFINLILIESEILEKSCGIQKVFLKCKYHIILTRIHVPWQKWRRSNVKADFVKKKVFYKYFHILNKLRSYSTQQKNRKKRRKLLPER